MDQMRKLIAESGLSGYRVAKETAIDQGTISRFLSGQRGLSSEAIDRIGILLDLEIVMHRPARKPSARRSS